MHSTSKCPSKVWSVIKHSQNKQTFLLPIIGSQKLLNHIRFVAIADTHSGHFNLNVPDGDVLLVGGDITLYDKESQLKSFDDFLGTVAVRRRCQSGHVALSTFTGTLPHSKKILIGGNHDLSLYENQYNFMNGEYLQDSGTIAFGYKIYGTPWTPMHFRGAFMLERGKSLAEKWDFIPDDTDILMTHTPPVGYGDKTKRFGHVGDIDLLTAVQNRIKPLVHVFGHIHEGKGSWTDGRTIFINSSVCDQHYNPVNDATIFDLPIIHI